jgi:hypothetical protein
MEWGVIHVEIGRRGGGNFAARISNKDVGV